MGALSHTPRVKTAPGFGLEECYKLAENPKRLSDEEKQAICFWFRTIYQDNLKIERKLEKVRELIDECLP